MTASGKCALLLALAMGGWIFTLSDAPAEPAKSAEEPKRLKVLDSQEVEIGPRSITYNRVETPVLKPQPAVPRKASAPAAGRAPTQAEIEEMSRWEALDHVGLYLVCMVYGGQYSEVHFRHGKADITFWSTANFQYLSGVNDLLTSEAYYSLLVWVSDSTLKESDRHSAEALHARRLGLASAPTTDLMQLATTAQKSSWSITSKAPVPPKARRAIEDLHAYYDTHRQFLLEQHTRRKAAELAQENEAKQTPPRPKDTVVQFFPIQSSHSPTEARTLQSASSISREP